MSDKNSEDGDPQESGEAGRGPLYHAIYSTSYYLSFGVVFPALLAARNIPLTPSMERGLRDGADAAGRSVEGVRQWSGDTYASAAKKVGETVEAVQDRFAERKVRGAEAEG